MECSHKTNHEEKCFLHKNISTCSHSSIVLSTAEASLKVKQTSLNLKYPPLPTHRLFSRYPRVARRRSVLLNLGISATLLAMLILQLPSQSSCVMTPATSPVSSISSSSSPSTNTPNTPINAPLSSTSPGGGGGGAYSLFPHEDLRTGKKIRFDDDRDRSLFRERERYRSSYPVIFDERYMGGNGGHYSGGYVSGTAVGVGSSSTSRYPPPPYNSQFDRNNFFEPVRTRGSRIYFDGDDRGRFPLPFYDADRYRDDRYRIDDDRYYSNRPTLLQRPFSPIQRPTGSNYLPEVSPGPSLSKLPVGATIGRSQFDREALPPYRIHTFNPRTNSFVTGNPRNRLGGFSETEAPGPDLFLNHDQYLEYHRKVALARDEEFRKIQKALENKAEGEGSGQDPKKVLFSSKQPFEIGGLSPPPRDGKANSQVTLVSVAGVSRPEGSTSSSSNNNNDISSLLSSPVEESSLTGANDKTKSVGQVSLFSASDARVPLLAASGGAGEEGSSADNHRVVHIHGNDPGGVLASTTTTGRTSESRGTTKGSKASVGEDAGGDGAKNVEVEESENAKSLVTQIPPNFISKSGRQLAYHGQPNKLAQVGNEGGRSTSSSTTYRTTTTMTSTSSRSPNSLGKGVSASTSEGGGGGVVGTGGSNKIKEPNNGQNYNEQEGTDFALTGRKSSNDFKNIKSSSTGRMGTALPLVQSNKESGINNNDGFFRPSPPDFQIPVRIQIESSGGGGTTTSTGLPASNLKAEKSALGTEVTKNRIKSNVAAKIAIIRQQELKQLHKERLANIKSYDDVDPNLNSVFDGVNTKSSQDDELTTTVYKHPIRITDTDIKNLRLFGPSTNSSASSRPIYKSTYKFPVLPKPPSTSSILLKKNATLETDAVEKLLKVSEDPFKKRDSILGNNDIINNKYKEPENGPTDDGHFTLINLHNDRVKILHDFDESGDNSHPQIEPPPSSQSYSLSPSFSDISDLDHGEPRLPTNDGLVNKTLPGIMNSSRGSYRHQKNPTSTAASTNFIRVVRVKNPLSLSPVPNNAAAAATSTSTADASHNKTNDNLLLSFYMQPNLLSQQNTLHINNKTSANFVSAVLIAGASINNAGSRADGRPNNNDKVVSTAEKTLSMFMAKKSNGKEHHYSSGFNNVTSSSYSKKYRKESYGINGKFRSKSVVIETDLGNKIGNGSQSSSFPASLETKKKLETQNGRPRGVVSRVHAHVSHCPKLKAPAEIICDIHIRERHDHPNPQLTVGWRRKYYNATQPDVLLVLNRTQAYDADSDDEGEGISSDGGEMKGWANIDVRNTSDIISAGKSANGAESAKHDGSMQDFHDKFNVTLAPGISPMLRSVLLIRGVTAPDCGNYQCEVSDGVNTLTSETLLFLCH